MAKARTSVAWLSGLLVVAGLGAGCASPERDAMHHAFWQDWHSLDPNIRGPESDTENHWAEHWRVIRRDLTDLHRSTDRHFFNYDWDDPYL